MYRQLDSSAGAEARLDEVTPLTPALEALGFTRLLVVTADAGAAPEAIWVHRGPDAFAEPSWGPGKSPQLSIRTFFADGSIVETTQPRTGVLRYLPFWPRAHHPAAGYFYEELEGMPHALWLRHRSRVEERREDGHPLAPHTTASFVAMARRGAQVGRTRTRAAQWLGLVILAAAAIPITLEKERFPQWLLPFTALLWAAATWGIHSAMLRLPSPRLRPAADLIARVEERG